MCIYCKQQYIPYTHLKLERKQNNRQIRFILYLSYSWVTKNMYEL